jgi:hypothetical protein
MAVGLEGGGGGGVILSLCSAYKKLHCVSVARVA